MLNKDSLESGKEAILKLKVLFLKLSMMLSCEIVRFVSYLKTTWPSRDEVLPIEDQQKPKLNEIWKKNCNRKR